MIRKEDIVRLDFDDGHSGGNEKVAKSKICVDAAAHVDVAYPSDGRHEFGSVSSITHTSAWHGIPVARKCWGITDFMSRVPKSS